MSEKKIHKSVLLIISVFFALLIIIAKNNHYNYSLLNRIDEITSLILGFIIIFGMLFVQITIEGRIKYLINSLLTGILLISLFFFLLGTNLCSENILSHSDNMQYDLFIIQKNCGATTSYEYKVLLRDRRTFLSKEKVIFKSYSYPVPHQVKFLNDNTVQIFSGNGINNSDFVVSFDKETLNTDKSFEFYNGKLY